MSAPKVSQVLPSALITTLAFTWVEAAGDSQRDSQDLPKKHFKHLKHTHTRSGLHVHSLPTHTPGPCNWDHQHLSAPVQRCLPFTCTPGALMLSSPGRALFSGFLPQKFRLGTQRLLGSFHPSWDYSDQIYLREESRDLGSSPS